MIFLNDPLPVENPQALAVKMSLEIREELNQLCNRWRTKDIDLNFGAGIASGFTTIGGIGAEGFWDYTVIGTATNVASRLCHAAKEGQILISHRFLNSVAENIDVELIGSLNLKGIHVPVSTYNVLKEKNKEVSFL